MYAYVHGAVLMAVDPVGLDEGSGGTSNSGDGAQGTSSGAVIIKIQSYTPRGTNGLDKTIDYMDRVYVENSTGDARNAVQPIVESVLAKNRTGPGRYFSGWSAEGGNDATGYDAGFRSELRDSRRHPGMSGAGAHVPSSNQTGHFLTAVGQAMHGAPGAKVIGARAGIFNRSVRHITMRIHIGHELVGDKGRTGSGVSGVAAMAGAATAQDVAVFEAALKGMNADPAGKVDLDKLQVDLMPIIAKIDPNKAGNSTQDLMLTALGWKYAELVESGAFEDQHQAAAWLRENLAEPPVSGQSNASGDQQ